MLKKRYLFAFKVEMKALVTFILAPCFFQDFTNIIKPVFIYLKYKQMYVHSFVL